MIERELESRLAFEDIVSRPPYEFDVTIHGEDSAWPNCYRDYHVHVGFDCWVESRKQLLGGQVIKESETVINSFAAFRSAISTIWHMWCEHKYIRLRWSTSKNRTLDQNALWAAMYQRISESKGDNTAYGAQEVKRYLKLHIGVPILRRDDEEFKALYDRIIKPHDYETKLKVMEMVRVTSEFNTKQGVEYTDSIVRHYHDNGVTVFFDDLLSN